MRLSRRIDLIEIKLGITFLLMLFIWIADGEAGAWLPPSDGAQDSLLVYLSADTSQFSAECDSARAAAILESLRQELFDFNRVSRDLMRRKISSDEADARKFPIAQKVRSRLEDAIQSDPHNRSVKRWLRLVYRNLEGVYRDREDWEHYIPIARRYLCTLSESNHHIFLSYIGNAHYELNQFDLSWLYYNKSIVSLFENYEDSLNAESPRYTRYLYSRMYRRATIEENQNRVDAALISLEHLLAIAPENQIKRLIAKYDRLSWDDRNVPASNKKIEAIRLTNDEQPEAAYEIYKEIIDSLNTRSARNEINYRMARIEYFDLKLRYQALNRLWGILKNAPLDSSGSFCDSSYVSYQKTYATMCYSQGIHELQLEHLRAAFIYFSKASESAGPYQARAFYYLTRIVSSAQRSVQHAQRTIEYGNRAWSLRDELANGYQRNLALLISLAYRESGEFDEALEWYKIHYRL